MECFRKECRLKKLGLKFHRTDVFCRSQWEIPPVLFVVYRILMAVYLTSWLFINALVFYTRKEPIVVWLTYWGYTVLCCHLVTAAVITTFHTHKTGNWRQRRELPREPKEETEQKLNVEAEKDTKRSIRKVETQERCRDIPWYMKMSWVFYSISCPAALEVTALYFFFLFPKVCRENGTTSITVDNFHVHAFNSMIITLEIILSAYPVRMLHFIYPIIFGVLYLLCTVTFWAAGRVTKLYGGMINWNKPGKTMLLMLLLGFVGTTILHLGFFGLYKLKLYISRRLKRRVQSENK